MFSGHVATPAVDHNWMFRKQRPQANGGNKTRPKAKTRKEQEEIVGAINRAEAFIESMKKKHEPKTSS